MNCHSQLSPLNFSPFLHFRRNREFTSTLRNMSVVQQISAAPTNDYIYVNEDTIDAELKCSVCQLPFQNPMSGAICGHTFCRTCISSWYNQNSSCPTCRRKTSFETLTTRIVLSQLDRLLVRCPHCNENNIQRCDLTGHVDQRCRQVKVRCDAADLKCTWTGKRDERAQHATVCPLLKIRPVIADLRAELNAQACQLNLFMDDMTHQLNRLQQQPSPMVPARATPQTQAEQGQSHKKRFDELMNDLRYDWTSTTHRYSENCPVCNYRRGGFLKCLVCLRPSAPVHIRIHDNYTGKLDDVICFVCVQNYSTNKQHRR